MTFPLSDNSADDSRAGFTLVEMVVVLGLIALLTHLAMRELSHLQDGRKTRSADAQLEQIRDAVYSEPAGSEPRGFLADMGRLPRPVEATPSYATSAHSTLSELWQRPSGVRDYAAYPATGTNLVSGLSSELSDASVFVPAGWRGPYAHLPLGTDELLDPWGNPITSPDMAGFDRLAITNGEVVAVSHFGPTAIGHNRRTVSIIPAGGATSRLIIYPQSRSGANYGEISYRWWGPCGGLITGAVVRAAYPASVVFTGLTPGRRVVKDSASGVTRLVDIRPGDNTIDWILP